MGRLTAAQFESISQGQPIRQVFSIRAPVVANHSAYTTTVIDNGWQPEAPSSVQRVVKAGTRTHRVWNPHPQEEMRLQAVRYSIEVANGDGYFHRKVGSPWNPFGLYDAGPAECFLLHSLFLWIPASNSWEQITHMDFVGRIIEVNYSGSAQVNQVEIAPGSTKPSVAPQIATITSEQDGAWQFLRRVFTADDGDTEKVTDATTGDFYIDFVA